MADLPLHGGRAPAWLFRRMVALAREILRLMVEEFGPEEVLRRLADPFWFQAFGCLLGFDWHSSGVTTTVCGAVQEAVKGHENDFGFCAAGGKGRRSRKTPEQILDACERTGGEGERLIFLSKVTAKVDSAAVQDGYQVYQHMMFWTPQGHWAVVQQGMNPGSRAARRYHWLDRLERPNLENDPHAAVCCDLRHDQVLNLVAGENAAVRTHALQIARMPPDAFEKELRRIAWLRMPRRHWIKFGDIDPQRLRTVQVRTYEALPEDFASLLAVPGTGPAFLRALTLASELIHGDRTVWRDPARYSFAHGGKDGTPYPVDRERYDAVIALLQELVNKMKCDVSEKRRAFRRLARFTADPARTLSPAPGEAHSPQSPAPAPPQSPAAPDSPPPGSVYQPWLFSFTDLEPRNE